MSTNYFSSNFTLGILGGGQLGKMLLQETRKWDIKTKVLDPSPDAPSKLACNLFEQGDLMDYQTVFNFGKTVDVLTIEIENVNIVNQKEFKNTVSELNLILHSDYQKNIEGY